MPLVQLDEGPGYRVNNAEHAWGTARAVTRMREALAAYHARFPKARPVVVHDLSRKGGGRLAPHHSHRRGRDVDVQVIRASGGALDVERIWFLIQTLVSSGDVQYVFVNRRLIRPIYRYAKERVPPGELAELFQWPRRGLAPGIVRHEPGHLGHFHVRFHRVPSVASAAGSWGRSSVIGPRSLVSLEPL